MKIINLHKVNVNASNRLYTDIVYIYRHSSAFIHDVNWWYMLYTICIHCVLKYRGFNVVNTNE